MRSRLSGVWETVDDPRDTLVIQRDGTFDFTGTMWAMAGDVSKLRKAGDSLERSQDGVRLEITESEFTPTTSYIRLKTTRCLPQGGEESGYGLYYAHLEADGRLAVRAGVPQPEGAPQDSLPMREYRRIGDAPPMRKQPPPPKETKDEWTALGRRHFAGENWFEKLRVQRLSRGVLNSVLLVPRNQVQAQRFLVARVEAFDDEWFEEALASSGADAAMVGCSILYITIPELDHYGQPDTGRAAELAHQVLDRTQEAVERLRPDKCCLETNRNATYIGHYLWQKDNSPYDAWFCWQPTYFYWYGASANVRRDKPALFLLYDRRNERDRHKIELVIKKYEADGFPNTRLTQLDEGLPNWSQQSIRQLAKAVGVEGLD